MGLPGLSCRGLFDFGCTILVKGTLDHNIVDFGPYSACLPRSNNSTNSTNSNKNKTKIIAIAIIVIVVVAVIVIIELPFDIQRSYKQTLTPHGPPEWKWKSETWLPRSVAPDVFISLKKGLKPETRDSSLSHRCLWGSEFQSLKQSPNLVG